MFTVARLYRSLALYTIVTELSQHMPIVDNHLSDVQTK